MAVTPKDDEGKPAVSLPPSTAQDVREYVQLQQDALLKSLQPIQDRMGQALVWQAANTGQLTKGLQKAVKARVREQQSALESIGNSLRDHIATLIDEQQVRLNHSILTLPSGVPATPSFFPADQTVPTADSAGSQVGACCWKGPRFNELAPAVQAAMNNLSTVVITPPHIPGLECPGCGSAISKFLQENRADHQAACVVGANADLNTRTVDYTINWAFPGNPFVQVAHAILPCRGAPTEPIPIEPPPPTPPPPTPHPPDCAKQWICNWEDLYNHLPGSSCDRPLYIVLCAPVTEPEVCPAPTENGFAQ